MSAKKKILAVKARPKSVKARPKRTAIASTESEYEADFSRWAKQQATHLKKKEFSQLDIDNLIEEIEDLSKREKQRLGSHLEILLMRKLKIDYQPGMRTTSWDASIKEATFKAQKTLKENPSLKPKLKEIFSDAYFSARLKAVMETGLEENTFPTTCKWQLKDVFPNLEKKYQ